MRLFVDTSAWEAVYDRADQNHRRAAPYWRELQRRGSRLLISDYIFDEAVTLAGSRLGHADAVRLGRHLLTSSLVNTVDVTEEIRRAAWDLFVRHDDKDFSFTDCTSFVIIRELGVTDVFAFDEHFAQMGFRVHPESGERPR